MPIEGLAEVAVEAVVQVGGELASETVHRRFGWKGCLALFVAVAALIALVVYLLA